VFEYDPEQGALGKRQTFTRIEPRHGFPDGLCVDSEGFVWVAVFGSWCVHRYSPDGELEMVIRLPARNVTSVGFGGPDLGELYVTSARERLGPMQLASQPLAGGLFRCRPGPRGRSQYSWAG
jgi:xylono-1,5-lactonase